MKFILGLIFCGLSILNFAQNDSGKKVSFIAYWSKGDSYDFLITKINKQWKGENLEKTDSSSYYALFTVIDSTENSYKVNWKYKANFEGLPAQFGELLNNNSVILDFIYTTNELGEFIGVENWEEISSLMKSTFSSVTNKAISKNPSLDVEKFNNAMEPFISIFTSKEGIEKLVLKELSYFHYPFGVEFNPDETLEYEDEVPNLINGGSMRADSKISFQSVDYENGFCVFTHEMKVNSDDAKNLVSNVLSKIGLKSEDLEIKLNESNFDIYDQDYFEYFYYPGLPYYIETSRIANIDIANSNIKREEIIRIELILDDD